MYFENALIAFFVVIAAPSLLLICLGYWKGRRNSWDGGRPAVVELPHYLASERRGNVIDLDTARWARAMRGLKTGNRG